jgi:predicted ATP-dependent Lon-type protease
MEQRYFSDNCGFISDYLAEALRASRLQNYSAAIEEDIAFGPTSTPATRGPSGRPYRAC